VLSKQTHFFKNTSLKKLNLKPSFFIKKNRIGTWELGRGDVGMSLFSLVMAESRVIVTSLQ
jgi:hypothetical protein